MNKHISKITNSHPYNSAKIILTRHHGQACRGVLKFSTSSNFTSTMKLTTIYTIFYSLLAFSLIGLFSGYSFGPAATVGMGYTGAPGDEALTCGSCHSANAFGAVNISMTSEGNPPSYSL